MCSSLEVRITFITPRAATILGRLLLWLAFAGWFFGAARSMAAPGANSADGRPTIKFIRNPDAAPDFALKSLDGQPLTLSAANGKVVLLNFWATWCGPCRMEIPDLIELQNLYKDRLQIISLLVDVDDLEEAKGFVKEAGINYEVGVATTDVRMEYGGISALPTLFVLDAEGRVVQKHVGLSDPRLYEIEIRALLGLPIPVKVETFEDTGEIFLKHADRASELPGVDFRGLAPEQKLAALHALNAEGCTCGCKLTLAQCRIYDSACATSKNRAAKIVTGLAAAPGAPEEPAAPSAKLEAPPAAVAPSAPHE
jgi:cytochrome c biogenesis protein CcmG/thiol:disulfide interchange protein DsbE